MRRLSNQSLRTISSLRKTDLKTHLKLFKSTATRAASSDQTLVAAAEYCRKCGSIVERIIPEGDFRLRAVCSSPGCGFIEYSNPRIVTGAIIDHQGKILLARRGINPQKGLWTVPAGFLELGESSADGAVRETLEETGANVAIIAPYCHYDIVGISQAYTLFRAKLLAPYTFKAVLPESLEVKLFAPTEIPFEEVINNCL